MDGPTQQDFSYLLACHILSFFEILEPSGCKIYTKSLHSWSSKGIDQLIWEYFLCPAELVYHTLLWIVIHLFKKLLVYVDELRRRLYLVWICDSEPGFHVGGDGLFLINNPSNTCFFSYTLGTEVSFTGTIFGTFVVSFCVNNGSGWGSAGDFGIDSTFPNASATLRRAFLIGSPVSKRIEMERGRLEKD